MRHLAFHVAACTALLISPLNTPAQTTPHPVVFMEPTEGAPGDSLDTFQVVTDTSRIRTYRGWLENASARWAFALFDQAREVAMARDPAAAARQPAAYYIALVPGGNNGDLGFRLKTAAGLENHARTAYIRLGPNPWRFGTTFLHETGHVVSHILARGRRPEARPMAAIPHSTAALSDRETAFQEGYAIHLETLMARLDTSRATRNKYDHEQLLFGAIPQAPRQSEYYHQLVDLLSFSQTVARYHEVAENSFAFRSAWKGPDYLRVQLEKSRDYAQLRDADQLLQSEGFYASFFYGVLFRGIRPPTSAVVQQRQTHLLNVLADVLERPDAPPNRPYLLDIMVAWQHRYPAEYPEILDVFLDLSHGVFVDPDAGTLWKRTYLAALRLDMQGLGLQAIEQRRQQWRERVLRDPQVLYSRVGPELLCLAKGPEVQLMALGPAAPLYFDINTVQEGVLAMISQLTPAERERWLEERDQQPFQSYDDFTRRVPLNEQARSVLVFNPE